MPTIKITRNFQVTIPAEVRSRAGIRIGDRVIVEYDERAHSVKIRLPSRERKTARLGRRLSAEEIDRAIGRGLSECLRS